jgi:DNA-binding NarL/FixJ family response regulator
MQAPDFTETVDIFTKQEKKVLKFVAEGLTNQEIATELFIAVPTVKKHRQNILQKAEVKGTVAIRKFIRCIKDYLD